MLAVLRIESGITPLPSRTRYPAAANLTGTGYTPARKHDLARPHQPPAWPAHLGACAVEPRSAREAVPGNPTTPGGMANGGRPRPGGRHRREETPSFTRVAFVGALDFNGRGCPDGSRNGAGQLRKLKDTHTGQGENGSAHVPSSSVWRIFLPHGPPPVRASLIHV